MEVIAKSKYVRISARKMRLVADLVRGLKVNEALEILSHLNKKPAQVLLLSLKQGIGNAVNNQLDTGAFGNDFAVFLKPFDDARPDRPQPEYSDSNFRRHFFYLIALFFAINV